MNFLMTKEVSFEAGHRLMNYEGKCKWIHGHNYSLEVTLASTLLNSVGMVEDFSSVKKVIKEYLDEHVDHGMILCRDDIKWINIMRDNSQKVYIIDNNPTAEALAEHFFHRFRKRLSETLGDHIRVFEVQVKETPTSYASYGEYNGH